MPTIAPNVAQTFCDLYDGVAGGAFGLGPGRAKKDMDPLEFRRAQLARLAKVAGVTPEQLYAAFCQVHECANRPWPDPREFEEG